MQDIKVKIDEYIIQFKYNPKNKKISAKYEDRYIIYSSENVVFEGIPKIDLNKIQDIYSNPTFETEIDFVDNSMTISTYIALFDISVDVVLEKEYISKEEVLRYRITELEAQVKDLKLQMEISKPKTCFVNLMYYRDGGIKFLPQNKEDADIVKKFMDLMWSEIKEMAKIKGDNQLYYKNSSYGEIKSDIPCMKDKYNSLEELIEKENIYVDSYRLYLIPFYMIRFSSLNVQSHYDYNYLKFYSDGNSRIMLNLIGLLNYFNDINNNDDRSYDASHKKFKEYYKKNNCVLIGELKFLHKPIDYEIIYCDDFEKKKEEIYNRYMMGRGKDDDKKYLEISNFTCNKLGQMGYFMP